MPDMHDVTTMPVLLEIDEDPADLNLEPSRRRVTPWGLILSIGRGVASLAEWLFGVVSLVLGLSILSALPLLQFLSLGYLLESSARVARSGRLRDGLIGVRRAALVGGMIAGIWLALLPRWLVASFARSAELIDPASRIARAWRVGLAIVTVLTFLHIAASCARGGRLRHFLWPMGHPWWLIRRLRSGGLYTEMRDTLWSFVSSLRLPFYFRLGLVGFLGTLAWLIPSAILIAAMGRVPFLGVVGALLLAFIVPFLPFLQVRYAVEGRFSALFSRRAVRDRFRRAPWAFAFALMVLLVAAIPLYLLKIEMIPREAAWLPSLVFVIFLAPARLLVGWAYARSGRRETPRHWIFRVLGRLAIIPAAALYVVVVFFAQYTSWGGVGSLFEQHAFLLPVPFLNM
ncbi:MAG TPA: hypothetical protein VGZ22_14145 [Isosphaeraceae bacterium]|jgi:hypothetical protein|nr:hypothetical protein [Isosphaeraceae bacterium]